MIFFSFKSAVPGLCNMFVAGTYPSTNKLLAVFTQLILDSLEHTNNYRVIFTGNFFVDVMNHSNVARNYYSSVI